MVLTLLALVLLVLMSNGFRVRVRMYVCLNGLVRGEREGGLVRGWVGGWVCGRTLLSRDSVLKYIATVPHTYTYIYILSDIPYK